MGLIKSRASWLSR